MKQLQLNHANDTLFAFKDAEAAWYKAYNAAEAARKLRTDACQAMRDLYQTREYGKKYGTFSIEFSKNKLDYAKLDYAKQRVDAATTLLEVMDADTDAKWLLLCKACVQLCTLRANYAHQVRFTERLSIKPDKHHVDIIEMIDEMVAETEVWSLVCDVASGLSDARRKLHDEPDDETELAQSTCTDK